MFPELDEYVGRKVTLLVPGIPATDIKITKATDEQIVGTYDDGEEIHVSRYALVAWWESSRREMRPETKEKIRRAKEESKKKKVN